MLSDASWMLLRRCLCRGANCFVQSDTETGLNAEIAFYVTTEEPEHGDEDAHDGHKHHGKEEHGHSHGDGHKSEGTTLMSLL